MQLRQQHKLDKSLTQLSPQAGCQLPQRRLEVSARLGLILRHFSTLLSEEKRGGLGAWRGRLRADHSR